MVSKMNKEFSARVAITYINEDVSMQVLADRFKVSKATIVRSLKSDKLPLRIRKAVEITKKNRWLEGKHTSGNSGNRIISQDMAKALATRMVEEDLSLADLVTEEGPSVGTMYNAFNEENLGSELYKKVTDQYAINIARTNFSSSKSFSGKTRK